MSESEEEWITVRRRRGARGGGVSKQLKALAIPVVPLAFDALAEPEERPEQEQSKSKKKKKSKKAKDADLYEQDGGGTQTSTLALASKQPSRAAKPPALGGQAGSQLSLFAWILSRLVAVLVMLGLMRGPGGSKKKRKSKAAAKAAEPAAATADGGKPAAAAAAPEPAASKAAPAAPAANKDKVPVAAAAAAAGAKAAAPAAPGAKAPAAATPSKKPEPQATNNARPAPAPASTPAAEAGTTTETPAKAAAAAPQREAPKRGQVGQAATAEPSKADPAAGPAGSKAAPAPAAVGAVAAPATPGPPPPPPPPAIKYDADWGRGKFVVQSLPTAHADVVSAVVMAGDVAVSAGYDGAVKLWHWPPPGTAGGSVAARPSPRRTLVGHSGRVEALAAHSESRRLVSSGRDSTLKVWDLGTEPNGSDAKELASTYVYESVRTLAADWTGEGGPAAGRVLLGARSGTVLLYSLGAGGGARKVAALRGHRDEVTALRFLGGSTAVSGSRDGTVRLWDLRAADKGAAGAVVLTGLSGRVCSLVALGDHDLLAGDCSSSTKLWDLRALPSFGARSAAAPAPRRLPNAPGFAGDVCPTAGLWHGPRSGVLVSSCIAWWTANKQALEEAPPSAKLPQACLNVTAVGAPATGSSGSSSSDLACQYQYTLRLGPGVVTCLAGAEDEGGLLAGGATGTLWALRLVRGGSAAAAAAERAAAGTAAAAAADGSGGCEVSDALVVGAEEFSDDEYGDDDDDDEELEAEDEE